MDSYIFSFWDTKYSTKSLFLINSKSQNLKLEPKLKPGQVAVVWIT